MREGGFIYGCGAFFALKIQAGKSAKQMEEFAKEVANLEKLRGHSNIVQIRDHSLHPSTHHVVILMELAACDLATFFKKSGYSFDVSSMFSIWRSLVNAVDAAHTQDIIHRDLKPQNFLLVPIAPPFADRILATTAVPSDNFEFRIVNRVRTNDPEKMGDVELILKDSVTGIAQVLQLIIKVSDFGLAQPLDLDEDENGSHLSVRGYAGTIKYMAPEAFQASEDAVQRLTKRVDIWALGVILFQMLHGGRTPFDRYCSPGNNIRAAVAIASKDIHAKVMKFERQSVWATEKRSLRCDPRAPARSSDSEGGDIATNVCQSSMAVSLLSTEFLFRICENCLAFESSDRVLAGGLKIWVGRLLDSNWWEQKMSSVSDAAVEALFSGVSAVSQMKDDDVETESQWDNLNLIQQGGDTIEQIFFPELRRAASGAPHHANVNIGIVALPASSRATGREGLEDECDQADPDDGAQLEVVVVPGPARGEVVEEREEAENWAPQGGAVLVPPTRGGDRGGCEEGAEGDRGMPLQAISLPATGETVNDPEERDDEEHLQVAQQLLPRCINEEDCGGPAQGAECVSERPRAPRPKRRGFAPPAPQSDSCGCNILGIIGVTLIVLALAAAGLFVVLKLIPPSHERPVDVSIPPTAPTFLAPSMTPSASPTAPVSGDPPAPEVHVVPTPPAPKVSAPPAPKVPVVSAPPGPAVPAAPPAPLVPVPTNLPASWVPPASEVPAPTNLPAPTPSADASSPSPAFQPPADRTAPNNWARFGPAAWDDEETVLAVVRKNGQALRFASSGLRSNRKVVLAAVLNDGMALQWASLEGQRKVLSWVALNDIARNRLSLELGSPELGSALLSWEALDDRRSKDENIVLSALVGVPDRLKRNRLWKDCVPDWLKERLEAQGADKKLEVGDYWWESTLRGRADEFC